MLIAIKSDGHCEFPDACPFHATKPNKLGVCGHREFSSKSVGLICQYTNSPSEHHNPPKSCPLIGNPIGGITVEMKH